MSPALLVPGLALLLGAGAAHELEDVPWVDLAGRSELRTVVDREPGQYLGHPTTVLLADGETLLAVYPEGHGRGPIRLRRSADGGRTWSALSPVPASWSTSLETPTIHRVPVPGGGQRLLLFSGLYPIRSSVSEDDGRTWTELEPIGDHGGIVAMSSLEPLADGSLLALFHDDGRFLRPEGRGPGEPPRFRVLAVRSADGGLTWSEPETVAEHAEAQLCEPGLVRSPDGKRMALLLREESRRFRSFVVVSDDEGRTWSEPRQVALALTGDRHVGVRLPDGRLFVSFRDRAQGSPTWGDWIGWVGTFEDAVEGRTGAYRVRLAENHVDADCGYAGVERLADGTIVATSYGHWTPGEEPYVVAVRFRVEDLDRELRTRRNGERERREVGGR